MQKLINDTYNTPNICRVPACGLICTRKEGIRIKSSSKFRAESVKFPTFQSGDKAFIRLNLYSSSALLVRVVEPPIRASSPLIRASSLYLSGSNVVPPFWKDLQVLMNFVFSH